MNEIDETPVAREAWNEGPQLFIQWRIGGPLMVGATLFLKSEERAQEAARFIRDNGVRLSPDAVRRLASNF